MGFDAGRLRRGELIAGGGGIVLFLALFLLPWFAVAAPAGTVGAKRRSAAALDGWHSLTGIRWILLLTIAVSLAVVAFTATRRSPAVPVTFSMFTVVLGALSSLLVLYRIIDHPGSTPADVVAKPGLDVGMLAALAIAYGGYLSLRTEGSGFVDPASIEVVPLARIAPGAVGRAEPDSVGRAEPDSASRTEAGRTGRDAGLA